MTPAANFPIFIDAGSSGEFGWHATQTFMECPQKYAWKYRSGDVFEKHVAASGDREPRLKGSLLHQGLAHYYARRKNREQGLDPDEYMTPEAAIEEWVRRNDEGAAKFVDVAKAALIAYEAYFFHEKLNVVAVEQVFEADIAGYKYTQRLDLVAEENNKFVVWDHKGVGRITQNVAARYVLSGQFLGIQQFGRMMWGDKFGGVKLNLVQWPSGKNGDFEFKRTATDLAPHALRLFPLTVEYARMQIDMLDSLNLEPNSWPKTLSETTCTHQYGKCDAFELCRWGK